LLPAPWLEDRPHRLLCERHRSRRTRDGRAGTPGCEKAGSRRASGRTLQGPGHEYVDNKDGYVWLIVEDDAPPTAHGNVDEQILHPVMKHRYLWEQANGPIPPGTCSSA
jgi:hypothetical protein